MPPCGAEKWKPRRFWDTVFPCRRALATSHGNWELTLGGKNLTDERYLVTGFRNNGVDFTSGMFNAPRTLFATLRIKS